LIDTEKKRVIVCVGQRENRSYDTKLEGKKKKIKKKRLTIINNTRASSSITHILSHLGHYISKIRSYFVIGSLFYKYDRIQRNFTLGKRQFTPNLIATQNKKSVNYPKMKQLEHPSRHPNFKIPI